MRRAIRGAGLFLLVCGAVSAQTVSRLEFEVASVKPTAPQTGDESWMGMQGGPGTADPGRITYHNVTLRDVLTTAYNVQNFQISGPSWIESEHYDFAARIPEGTTKEQFRTMLQNLLADRFKLGVHHETREFPRFELVVNKGGVKMKETVIDPNAPNPGAMSMGAERGRYVMKATGWTTERLAGWLGVNLHGIVLDQTGLTKKYDVTLEYSGDPNSDVPRLPEAVQDQLGLKLEQRKGPLDVLVIDRGEKTPSAN